MSTSRSLWHRQETVRRAAAPYDDKNDGSCSVFGCTRQCSRAAGRGLSYLHCRYHTQHIARHGSPYHKSLTARETGPYLKAATIWMRSSSESPHVKASLTAVEVLLKEAGRALKATELKGLSPERRARVALARLREAGVKPSTILTHFLATSASLRALGRDTAQPDYRIVQYAKAVHRLASGYHLQALRLGGVVLKSSFYPETRGLVLRHMGKKLEACCRYHMRPQDIQDVIDIASAQSTRAGR